MASVKERLTAHCDRLAFGIVAAIIVAMIAVTMTGEDKIKTSQDRIAQHLKLINDHAKDAELLPAEAPPDPREAITRRSDKASIPKEAWTAFAMEVQPAVVRIYSRAATLDSVHGEPAITSVAITRDAEKKKPVATVTFRFGELSEVSAATARVERRAAGAAAWRVVATIPHVDGTEVYTCVDADVKAGSSYTYRVTTTATRSKSKWRADSGPTKTSGEPAPPEADLGSYVIPDDLRVMFVQGKIADDLSGAGEGYFKVDAYDYAAGAPVSEPMIKREELLGLMRKPDADKDLLPRTRYYLNVIKQGEKGLVAVLKDIDTRREIQLPQGVWVPESIECPKAWELPAAPQEEEGEETLTPEETPPAEAASEAPGPDREAGDEPPAEEPAGAEKEPAEDEAGGAAEDDAGGGPFR
ncbi:MAG TPA: hypothetical protein PKX48_11725 [Planctomycetota bacterium]|jgi:hypothetical protein|nr:hypothetical protein [Planctomycetota bacterium]OQC22256.1 MAG: hypothetical protein BWX69_00107 [Planctomycetes bacterium ADurb.Bin069]HNS00139.1 hypothetical protein [Planctomycetota bacterium]HNU25909.1 hypothetical protein [Planctomycetota bacterium]HOE29293.1 hypothetical protein [Planctomycetota bacterium]